MRDLNGANVLLTGASSGIGRALAVELAGKGARVAIVARREQLLEELADEVEAKGAERPRPFPCDLGRPGNAAQLAERVSAEHGPVDVLVNNAGGSLQGMQWNVGDCPEGREVFETNLWSPLALVGALVPAMRSRGGGSVVNVTSLVQVSPFPALGHYCSSKAALGVATQTLALELAASMVNVLEVVLGPVDTPGSAESRLLPGGKQWLNGAGLGNADDAARQIVNAIEKGSARLVYPRRLAPAYGLPGIARFYAKRFVKYADPDDDSVRLGGSAGDPANQEMRSRWDARQAAPERR
jgi:short-subunit dehydrogenase